MNSFNPLDYPACLAQPLRLRTSSWMEHVPFGMFLIDLLRPKVLVELGTFFGVSYCAFCQTVNELKTGTQCYAVDTWEGDSQAGLIGDEALEDLKEHHDELYRGFSQLIKSTFAEALNHFGDDSIDLLHIDGFHTYDAVSADFRAWLPKMTEQGVVILHDVNVREGGFGVWKLWAELKQEFPHFEMVHGYGLGLVAVGPQPPEALRLLTNAAPEEQYRIRNCFYRLGRGIEAIHELQAFKQEILKSPSFKLGRTLTYPLRKLRGGE